MKGRKKYRMTSYSPYTYATQEEGKNKGTYVESICKWRRFQKTFSEHQLLNQREKAGNDKTWKTDFSFRNTHCRLQQEYLSTFLFLHPSSVKAALLPITSITPFSSFSPFFCPTFPCPYVRGRRDRERRGDFLAHLLILPSSLFSVVSAK